MKHNSCHNIVFLRRQCKSFIPIWSKKQDIVLSNATKGVNLVPEAVPVWSKKRDISIPVNTGVPFRIYRYFIYIYIYLYIYI